MIKKIICSLVPITLFAAPSNHHVMHGAATVSQDGKKLTVKASDKAILHWESFSSGAGELVEFIQPGEFAAVLNRVTGNEASRLEGQLLANGQVFLINPRGILIGPGAHVRASSFYAATLDVLNDDFLKGVEFLFQGESQASVINLGTIEASCGDIMLMAAHIDNQGHLLAEKGTVGLGAGLGLVIKPADRERIYVMPGGEASLHNSGTIEALQAELKGGQNPYGFAFVHGGTIDAMKIEDRGGEVYLACEEGFAEISGLIRAENISVKAKQMVVKETARIDASKEGNGGFVDLSGICLFIEKGAEICADGGADGGAVLVWGDETCHFFGAVSARGENGGFAEISAPGLMFDGFADLSARSGNPGELLLDPTDVIIGAVSDPCVVLGALVTWPTCVNPVNISGAAIAAVLAGGTAVTIDTSTLPNLGGSGDVTINTPTGIGWGGPGAALTINAERDIIINGTNGVQTPIVSTTPGSHITLHAVRNITTTGSIINRGAAPGANITLIADTGDITATNNFTAVPGNLCIGNDFGTVLVRATEGSITLTAGSTLLNNLTYIGPSRSGLTITTSGDINVEAGQDITLTAGNSQASSAGIGRSPPASGVQFVTGNITVTAGGDISLTAGGATDSRATIGSEAATIGFIGSFVVGDYTVSAGGNITLTSGTAIANFNRAVIGADPGFSSDGLIQSNLVVNVGGDLLMQGQATIPSPEFSFIGFSSDDLTSSGSSTTSVRVNVGGNIYLDGRHGHSVFEGSYRNLAVVPGYDPICFIHCLGDIFLLGADDLANGGSAALLLQFIDPAITNYTTHLWAGGGIYAINGSRGNFASVITDTGSLGGTQYENHSTRAGGDITQASNGSNYISIGTGSFSGPAFSGFFFEADTCFAAGELWAAQSATVNGFNILASTPVGVASPAIVCDGTGAFAIDTALYNLSLLPTPYDGSSVALGAGVAPGSLTIQTANADVVIHSANTFAGDPFRAQFAAGNPADFTIGAPTNSATITVTGSGDIEIAGSDGPTLGGCGCTDSFRDIVIQTLPNPWTATGSIYVSATNDLTSTIVDIITGGASPITLISDADDSGTGNVTLSQSVTSNGGTITIDAGFGASGGTSSIQLIGETVGSNGGAVIIHAVGDVFISGAASSVVSGAGNQTIESTHADVIIEEDMLATTGNISVITGLGDILVGAAGSVSTTSGNISLNSGNDIEIDGDAVSLFSATGRIDTVALDDTRVFTNVNTAGEILMITGNDMFLFGTADITSTTGSVTLVVDNDFPTAPQIGIGAFFMEAAARVNAGPGQPLQIFTALQPLNSILGLLNGSPFAVGTIFNDTVTEHWCIYYPNAFFGGVFTIFYKNCFQEISQVGNLVASELLSDFDSASEFLDWPDDLRYPWRYAILYDQGAEEFSSMNTLPSEPYWIQRQRFRLLHNPVVIRPLGK